VDDALAVRVRDRVADLDEPPEQVAQHERPWLGVMLRDRVVERAALDELHRVVRPALLVLAERVDGDDAGVLELAGDLGLVDEALAELRDVGQVRAHLLERDLAPERLVERDRNGAEPAARVRAQDHVAPAPGGAGTEPRQIGFRQGRAGRDARLRDRARVGRRRFHAVRNV
jgi:hypothetical protein